jgi:perosamine synthetase
MSDTLAILGGNPEIREPLRPYAAIGRSEVRAALRVLKSGLLSGYLGAWAPDFWGGPTVRRLEDAWAEKFGARHAVAMNSATSGLIAAMGAIGLGPGDEVIVPPYTMSATAVCPLFYGGSPVFADIDENTFCLDVNAVRSRLTAKTKAIIAVNLFGHPAQLHELRALATQRGVALIEDNAQAPLAQEHGRFTGTIGAIGVFSLNFHKHIHSGEGCLCVTNDDELALRLKLIRNHGENVVDHVALSNRHGLVGFNFRMSELSAAVALEQLRNLDHHVARRETAALRLTEGVRDLPGIVPPVVRAECRHVFYQWVFRVDERAGGVTRRAFSEALAAEGFPHAVGYVKPLYLLPLFQQRLGFGTGEWPLPARSSSFEPGSCPVAERMHFREVCVFSNTMFDLQPRDVDRLIGAIRKVHSLRHLLPTASEGIDSCASSPV